jgi:teichuronic acid biosynthesis glycosyltransferase TuaG
MPAVVSIITPSYNSEQFIAETIKSVQNQTFPDWEMIIVDDCSNDRTIETIAPFLSDPRIKLHVQKENAGAGVVRNKALTLAEGRYIAFLDSDDLWKPEKLEKQLQHMAALKQPFSFSFYECIDEEGNPLHKRIEAPGNLSYRQLFFCNFVGNLTGMYDTGYFGKIAISSIRKRQDWIVWLTILKQLKTAKPFPESLAYYRVRKNSISSSKWALLNHNYVVYRTYHQLNPVLATLSMIGFLFTQLFIKPLYKKKI